MIDVPGTADAAGESTVRVSPHLCFDGRCEEAFQGYQQIFGGSLATMLRYGASPLAAQTPLEWHEKILHATLELDGTELTGVDSLPGEFRPPQGFFVTISIAGAERAGGAFTALADGGVVQLPFTPTFWSPGFGVCTDRYGVPWEINATGDPTFAS
jgi:PhnB protein